jgi:hypothetical protein
MYKFDEIDTIVDHSIRREMIVNDNDPLSARNKVTQSYRTGRPGWLTAIQVTTEMTCDQDHFYLTAELKAYEGDALFFQKIWSDSVKRDWL